MQSRLANPLSIEAADRSGCPATLLAFPLLLLGLLLIGLAGSSGLKRLSIEPSVPVSAQVIESTTAMCPGPLGQVRPSYRFSYRYIYQGEIHVSQAYRFDGGTREAVHRHPVGTMLTAWVDPTQPGQAVIHPGLQRREILVFAVGGLLLSLGLIGFFCILARERQILDRARGLKAESVRQDG